MKPSDNPHYKKIYNLLDAVQIEVANAVIDILAEKQNQVDKLTAELEKVTQIRDDYATAARTIALYLKDYCDESLPYHEMIADAARRAYEELSNLPMIDPDYVAKLEALLDLVAEDIEWQELHRADSPKFKPIITLYRELRPKEALAK